MSQSSQPPNHIDQQHEQDDNIWVYFEQCDQDNHNKVKCILCAVEIMCKNGQTSILMHHIKQRHSLELLEDDKTKTIGIEHNSIETNNNNMTRTTNNINNNNSNISNNNDKTKKQSLEKLRSKLDILDYNDIYLTTKPLTKQSTSLSKNLLSRLNQLSSPLTRRLKFWNKKSFQVSQYDPCFKVIYLGNLGMQLWSKDESCLEKPLSALWNNYLVNMKTEIVMRLTICNSGLKAITRQHGLTQYWSNRLVYCCSHRNYPRIFSWIYRHEGKKMRQELRCHAVLCPSPEKAAKMVTLLNQRLICALQEFKREKKSRGLSLNNNVPSMQEKLPRTIPLRRQILAKGTANFRPPLERSKSAPKLTSISEEEYSDSSNDDLVSESDNHEVRQPLPAESKANDSAAQDILSSWSKLVIK